MGRCQGRNGRSKDQKTPRSKSTDTGLQPTTTALRWCATSTAQTLEGTSTLIIVVLRILHLAVEWRFSIFRPGCDPIQRNPRIWLLTAFTGNEWVRHSVLRCLYFHWNPCRIQRHVRAADLSAQLTNSADPHSKDDQARFAKWWVPAHPRYPSIDRCVDSDHTCGGKSFSFSHRVTVSKPRLPGVEHRATATNPAQPSYCTLPMFHPPASTDQAAGLGYVSNDGHVFRCRNPVV